MYGIMIVEDEPAALARYAAYVEQYGVPFRVAARCATAEEAVRLLAETDIAAVFADVRMPGEDGLSMLERMRGSGWDGAAVIISGYDEFAYAQKAIQLGVFDYLLKPVFAEDMRRLLARLAAALEARERPGGPGGKPAAVGLLEDRGRMPVFIRRALALLDTHLCGTLSLRDLAEHAHVSPAYLSTCFKKFCGYSPSEYSRRRRILEAQRILLESDVPLKQVADRLGFPDVASFSKLFRRIVGTSPGAFRKVGHGPQT